MSAHHNLLHENELLLEKFAKEIDPYFLRIRDFLFEKLKTTDRPLSIYSLSTFVPKVDSLRNGIFITLSRDEHYSANILFRAIIEHSVKAIYIWVKILTSSDDQIGIDYWTFGQDRENVDYVKSLENTYKILNIKPPQSAKDILNEIGVTSEEKSLNLIREKSEQFVYKNMVAYLAISQKDIPGPSLFNSILTKYSELSSFVHGGPASVKAFCQDEQLKEMIEISTFFSLLTKWTAYLVMAKYDSRIEPIFEITNKYLEHFFEEEQSNNQESDK